MNINDFISTFMNVSHLGGQTRQATIGGCALQEVAPGRNKPVLSLTGIKYGLPLNKTNAQTLAQAFGGETDAWQGKTIELYPTKVDFQGKQVDAIRVRIPAQPAAQEAPAKTNTEAEIDW